MSVKRTKHQRRHVFVFTFPPGRKPVPRLQYIVCALRGGIGEKSPRRGKEEEKELSVCSTLVFSYWERLYPAAKVDEAKMGCERVAQNTRAQRETWSNVLKAGRMCGVWGRMFLYLDCLKF